MSMLRSRWAAVGAAVAVTLGAGGVSLTQAAIGTGPKPVYIALDAPCRVIDTRSANPIGAGDANTLTVQITGTNGDCTGTLAVPAAAVAVATNVTVIQPNGAASGRSYFTVYPADATQPTTSNLNFVNGQAPTPNKVDVGLSTDGKIKIYNNEGTAHAAVDIFGYYIDHHHDDRYYTETEVDAALSTKANTTDTYTKTQTDAALSSKANTAAVYTKAQSDAVTGALGARVSDLEAAVAQLTNSVAAFSSSPGETELTGAAVVYQSLSMLPPADGVVVVNSHAYFSRDGDDLVLVRCGISTSPSIDTDFLQIVTIPSSGTEGFEDMSATRAFEVTEGDLFTVNLVCTAPIGTGSIGQPTLSAIFAPD